MRSRGVSPIGFQRTKAITDEASTGDFAPASGSTYGPIELRSLLASNVIPTRTFQEQEDFKLNSPAYQSSSHSGFEDEEPDIAPEQKEKSVKWRDLPNKKQLAILTIARLSEPLSQTSLQAYMFYQLKSFDPNLPEPSIYLQAGLLQASFTAAQFLTAMLWGRFADADRGGRKMVLLIGILGASVSCLGYGFSSTFRSAVFFRMLGGAMNGNPGVTKTMVSEIIREKRFQSRAFLLLPMCFNIGVIIGPILGGLLASPVENYPRLFGDNSLLGGKHGVSWMRKWPYALPNVVAATYLFTAAMVIFFGLQETLESLRYKPDLGLRIRKAIYKILRQGFSLQTYKYTVLESHDFRNTPYLLHSSGSNLDFESRPDNISTPVILPQSPKPRLPLNRIWTRNVLSTLISHGILSFHVSAFQTLWFVYLSTPRFDPSHPFPPFHTKQSLPFNFTGGLGMPSRSVGFAMAMLGTIGITLQLVLYPSLSQRLGTILSFRLSLLLFPISYSLAPYLAIIPSSSPGSQATGILIYLSLTFVLFIQVLARTFALPATIILVNNSCPHPSVLGTMHGVAQSVNSGMRTLGPLFGGWVLGLSLGWGVVGGVWWMLAGVAVTGWVASGFLYEGSGHEIVLEGE